MVLLAWRRLRIQSGSSRVDWAVERVGGVLAPYGIIIVVVLFLLFFGSASLDVGFWGDHNTRFDGTPALNVDVSRPHEFIYSNYVYLLKRLTVSDSAVHYNRLFWFLLSGVLVSCVARTFWQSRAAAVLTLGVYFLYPTISTQRLWSPGFLSSMAVCFGCACIMLELQLLNDTRFRLSKRIVATVFYLVSVFALEFFAWLPLLVLYLVWRARARQQRRAFATNLRAFLLLYVPAAALVGFLALVHGRKESVRELAFQFSPLGFLKSVYGQLSSNIGDRFVMFSLETLYRAPASLSLGEIFAVSLFPLLILCLFFFLSASGPSDIRRRYGDLLALSGLWIALSTVINSLGANYGFSLGYIEDRINASTAAGGAFLLGGLVYLGHQSPAASRRALAGAALVLMLLSFGTSTVLQTRDWAFLKNEENRIRRSLAAFSAGSQGADLPRNIILSNLPRYVSSFPFNESYIHLLFPITVRRGDGHAAMANYLRRASAVHNDRGALTERVWRHLSGQFRFWPLLLSPYWPRNRYISDAPGVEVFHVDELYKALCASDGIYVFRTSIDRGALSSDIAFVDRALLLYRDPRSGYDAAVLDSSNCPQLLPAKFRLRFTLDGRRFS